MSMTEKVLVRVNPNCYIRYPRESGNMYSGTWGSVTRPDGKQANTWTGDEFECEKAFAKTVNESLTNHNVPFTATAEPRPILTVVALIEDTLPIVKSKEVPNPAQSEIEVQETETISVKSKPGPKPKVKQVS